MREAPAVHLCETDRGGEASFSWNQAYEILGSQDNITGKRGAGLHPDNADARGADHEARLRAVTAGNASRTPAEAGRYGSARLQRPLATAPPPGDRRSQV